jgi:mono/diheme cytochrome c family protein
MEEDMMGFRPILICTLAILGGVRGGWAADAARGKATYNELCAKCHGATGKGDGKESATLATKPKDLTDCQRLSKSTDEQLFKVIKEGGPAGGLSKDMPSYAESLEDDEMHDTVAYIRSLCRK